MLEVDVLTLQRFGARLVIGWLLIGTCSVRAEQTLAGRMVVCG